MVRLLNNRSTSQGNYLVVEETLELLSRIGKKKQFHVPFPIQNESETNHERSEFGNSHAMQRVDPSVYCCKCYYGTLFLRLDLPGFTRSVYKRDHALITPESHVFSPLPDWANTLGAYLITPAMGSHFVMYLAKMQENARSGLPPEGVERLIFVIQGAVNLTNSSRISDKLMVDSYAYLPPNFEHSLKCDSSATLVVFERRYAFLDNHITEQIVSSTDKLTLLETPGEVFELRKLLPESMPYDFNIHIMDFQPGEFLNVKEVHYNQHGLLLLEGQGIYRLGDSWYPVQAGDVIWMAPFVPQWYAALGKTRSQYLLYKDLLLHLLHLLNVDMVSKAIAGGCFQSICCRYSGNVARFSSAIWREKFQSMEQIYAHCLWEHCNAIVLSWILNMVSQELSAGIFFVSNALRVWEDLKEHIDKIDGSRVYFLHREIVSHSQGTSSISVYYTRLRLLWDEYDVIAPFVVCNCEILLLKPLLSVNQAYSMLVQEEGQRQNIGRLTSILEPTALYSSTLVKKCFHGVCHYCHIKGHKKETCYKLIDYPADYKFNKRKGSAVNNVVLSSEGESTSSLAKYYVPAKVPTFTREHYQQILEFLGKDPPVQATTHMAGIRFVPFQYDWILDTGATNHMTFDIEQLSSYVACDSSSFVQPPNGKTTQIAHKGTYAFSPTQTLTNVLHVPDFHYNLLGEMKGIARSHNGLYILKSSSSSLGLFIKVLVFVRPNKTGLLNKNTSIFLTFLMPSSFNLLFQLNSGVCSFGFYGVFIGAEDFRLKILLCFLSLPYPMTLIVIFLHIPVVASHAPNYSRDESSLNDSSFVHAFSCHPETTNAQNIASGSACPIPNLCSSSFSIMESTSFEPKTYYETAHDKRWVKAMQHEIHALEENGTWTVVDLPPNKRPIGCKWVYQIKYNSDGSVERFKTWLVSKGYSQCEGVDFHNTFSPVAKQVTVHTVIVMAAMLGWELYQMNVFNAFLKGDLHEEVYMTLPDGFRNQGESRVCRLLKSLYGLKQASRQ
ncbi:(S)-ureidoglycine aminohydrolase [Hibiscus syriacus]|uniref:(S)-ureidoglycine aminohydrolase n=1 Tax=Hibiscus syriacus TaxID=106335 RepID=A0A6A3B9B1_HIBSY|nr:(S)-ureidoglycine aminohydrolase [Hibiscus syriacus]